MTFVFAFGFGSRRGVAAVVLSQTDGDTLPQSELGMSLPCGVFLLLLFPCSVSRKVNASNETWSRRSENLLRSVAALNMSTLKGEKAFLNPGPPPQLMPLSGEPEANRIRPARHWQHGVICAGKGGSRGPLARYIRPLTRLQRSCFRAHFCRPRAGRLRSTSASMSLLSELRGLPDIFLLCPYHD